jgi:hypothetical protein
MRYEKADNLLQLALEMQAAHGGLSLADIETKFGVGHLGHRGPPVWMVVVENQPSQTGPFAVLPRNQYRAAV